MVVKQIRCLQPVGKTHNGYHRVLRNVQGIIPLKSLSVPLLKLFHQLRGVHLTRHCPLVISWLWSRLFPPLPPCCQRYQAGRSRWSSSDVFPASSSSPAVSMGTSPEQFSSPCEEDEEASWFQTSIAAVMPMMWCKRWSLWFCMTNCASISSVPNRLPQSRKSSGHPTVLRCGLPSTVSGKIMQMAARSFSLCFKLHEGLERSPYHSSRLPPP